MAKSVMKFVKMHGIGNDYVFVDCFKECVNDPVNVARLVSDRHFGVGSDGLILIEPSEKADVKMRIFNADGSEAEMCGNGVRCVAKYVYDYGIVRKSELSIETLAGIKTVGLTVKNERVLEIRVNMGKPLLLRGQIPMAGDDTQVVDEVLEVCGVEFSVTCVSMGNPHCVVFVDDLKGIDLCKYGPLIENHELFPERINVHFVHVVNRNEVEMVTWERGSGVTLACGTGASAVAVAGVLTGRSGRNISAHLPGGDLRLEWAQDENVYMTGSATETFKGEVAISG